MTKRSKSWIGILGVSMVVDGLLSLAFGRRYVSLWQVGRRGSLYRRAVDWLLGRPPWLLRAAGAVEAGLGVALMKRAPLEVRTLYALVAPVYDFFIPIWYKGLYRDAHRALDQALAAYLPPDGRVLDLGCGTGANLDRLLKMDIPFGAYVGVDLSPAMLARAERKFGDRPGVRFEECDLMVDPLPEGLFDLIVSTWVFEHLADPAHVVQEAWDRLRSGGHMVLLFEVETPPWRGPFWNYIFRFFRSRLVPRTVYEGLPGRMAFDRFAGPMGDLALIVLHKPKLEGMGQ